MPINKLSSLYENVLINVNKAQVINEDFTEAVINQLTDKFLELNPNQPPEYIKKVVTRFGILRTNNVEGIKRTVNNYIRTRPIGFDPKHNEEIPIKKFEEDIEKLKNSPLDVNRYTFKQLDEVVGSFRWEEEIFDTLGRIPPAQNYPAPVTFNEDGLVVLYAQDFADSSNIKAWMMKQDDRNYTFCLCGGESTYQSYRFGHGDAKTMKTLYFVHDSKQPKNSINRVNVVQRMGNGQYFYTQAPNHGPDKPFDWEALLAKNPRLNLIKNPDKVFKFVPLTDKEEQELAIRYVRPENFKTLTKYKSKLAYISIMNASQDPLQRIRRLYKEDYINLPKELQHSYIQVRALDQFTPTEILLLLTTELFVDSDSGDLITRINDTQKELNAGINNWLKPLTLEPTVMQYSTSNTREYYKKLIYRFIGTLGGLQRVNEG